MSNPIISRVFVDRSGQFYGPTEKNSGEPKLPCEQQIKGIIENGTGDLVDKITELGQNHAKIACIFDRDPGEIPGFAKISKEEVQQGDDEFLNYAVTRGFKQAKGVTSVAIENIWLYEKNEEKIDSVTLLIETGTSNYKMEISDKSWKEIVEHIKKFSFFETITDILVLNSSSPLTEENGFFEQRENGGWYLKGLETHSSSSSDRTLSADPDQVADTGSTQVADLVSHSSDIEQTEAPGEKQRPLLLRRGPISWVISLAHWLKNGVQNLKKRFNSQEET